jgi:thiamine biosynthesis lipoprotein
MQRLVAAGLIAVVACFVAVGQWQIAKTEANQKIAVVARPEGVMGTECTLAVVVTRNNLLHAQEALRRAETVIRGIESRMSSWLDNSEISQFAAAKSGQTVPLSADTLAVLEVARDAFDATKRTFDITCRPQLQIWREARERGQVPSRDQLAGARQASHWDLVEWTSGGLRKRSDTVCFDLGGIAKGYAIDRALDALQCPHVRGSLVEIGGDLACSGRRANGETWQASVRNPACPEPLVRLNIVEGSVATSGNYARYLEINGRKYSHIIDPRTSQPVDEVVSVTVVAPTAVAADIWATALSVHGSAGFILLPENVQALLILAGNDDRPMVCTSGFRDYLLGPAPDGLRVWQPPAEQR